MQEMQVKRLTKKKKMCILKVVFISDCDVGEVIFCGAKSVVVKRYTKIVKYVVAQQRKTFLC